MFGVCSSYRQVRSVRLSSSVACRDWESSLGWSLTTEIDSDIGGGVAANEF